jgi:predicted amidohydrolase YtcJ
MLGIGIILALVQWFGMMFGGLLPVAASATISRMAPDLIVTNGKLLTQNPKKPRAEALAIKGNTIVKVGSAKDVLQLKGRKTRVIDAGGATVLPGFIESHAHLFGGAAELANMDCFGARGVEGLKQRYDAFVAGRPGDGLILGNGVDYTVISDKEPLTRHHLDLVAPDRPLLVLAPDHHTGWANSKALEMASILRGKTLEPGHEIVMEDGGFASGELREILAIDPVMQHAAHMTRSRIGFTTGGDPDPYPSTADFESDLVTMKLGLEHIARHGITSLHNMDGNLYTLELLAELERRGELTARVRVPFHFKPFMPVTALERASTMAAAYQGPMVSSGFVKFFMDGVLDSWTAVMMDDYADRAGWKGDPLFSQEQFNQVAVEADRRGLQMAVHAIGDGAVNMVLNGYEAARKANGKRDSRHRIEHIEVVLPDDIPRFRKLGVIASMQPPHPPGLHGLPLEPTVSRIGKDKWPYAYAWKTLDDAGARVVFGTDWPVSDVSAMRAVHSAVTRGVWAEGMPEQRATLAEALERYTVAGAFTEFAEDEKGSLRKGMLADVVVLDQDIERIDPAALGGVGVRATVCDGRVVFEG